MLERIQFVSPTKMLIFALTTLLVLGLVMVYSSSALFAEQNLRDSTFFLKRQLIFFACALVALFVGTKTRTETYRQLAYPMYFGVLFLLVLVLIPGIGKSA